MSYKAMWLELKSWVNSKRKKKYSLSIRLEIGSLWQPGLILTFAVQPWTGKVSYYFGLVLIFLYIISSKLPWEFLAIVHWSKRAQVLNGTIFDVKSYINVFAFCFKERSVPITISQKCSLKCQAGPWMGRCASSSKHLSIESIKHLLHVSDVVVVVWFFFNNYYFLSINSSITQNTDCVGWVG